MPARGNRRMKKIGLPVLSGQPNFINVPTMLGCVFLKMYAKYGKVFRIKETGAIDRCAILNPIAARKNV